MTKIISSIKGQYTVKQAFKQFAKITVALVVVQLAAGLIYILISVSRSFVPIVLPLGWNTSTGKITVVSNEGFITTNLHGYPLAHLQTTSVFDDTPGHFSTTSLGDSRNSLAKTINYVIYATCVSTLVYGAYHISKQINARK